jgi:GT2 family glycosyltransferase
MQKHDAEYILLLNEDAYLAPDHLERCLKRFEQDPQAGAVVGIVYRWTAPVDQEEVVGPETFVDTIELEYRCLANVVDRAAGKQRKDIGSELNEARRVMGVSGAVCMIKRSAAEAVSPEKLLFDPTFFMYREDVDLAIRLHRKGFHAWFDPSILSFHRRSIKAPKGIYARILDERKRPAHLREVMFRNQWKLYAYHGSLKLGAYDVLRSLAHEAIHLVFIFLSSPSVYFRGVLSILYAWPEAWRRRKALAALGLEHHPLL